MLRHVAAAASSLAFLAVVACNKSPAEPATADNGGAAASSAAKDGGTTAAAAAVTTTGAATDSPGASAGGTSGADPTGGNFTLADATKGLAGTGPIMAKIDTDHGAITCKLYDDKAPLTVANFVGLARGIRPFQDPKTGSKDWVQRPAYDGTTFHRIIKGFMIQGGDPKGTGTGEPGYTVKDEIWPGAKHDRAGQICMANRGPNTNGMQFFITDAAATFLDGKYTIFGECTPEQTIHDLAGVPVTGEKPNTPPVIKSVTISRGAK
jgi:peptidyl-prolyl cis-trans isomerase A (cyclophilin A)